MYIFEPPKFYEFEGQFSSDPLCIQGPYRGSLALVIDWSSKSSPPERYQKKKATREWENENVDIAT